MKSEIRTILLGIGQFLFCALLSASAYGLYVLNLRVSVPVESLIELGQEALFLSAAIFTLRTASLEKALSGGLWLVGGFLVALFIRELDGWIGHAWVYCELVWLCGVAWAVKAAGLGTVIPGLAHFIGHRAFPIMCTGVAILLAYSPPSMQATACECAAAGPAPNAYRRRPASRPPDKAAARKKEGTRILMDMGPFVHSAFESRRGLSEAFDRFGAVILT